ncbi:hypothetical protein J4207_01175 [Candidatus Woesearchaeota archaeon]|nr:hypothetical protein [Candidatus Woesearchaeota archaeon]
MATKIGHNRSLLKLVGMLTPKEADAMEKTIAEGRALSRNQMDKLMKEFE